ncbi:MAG: hypothetical protein M0R80_08670 [Proteobacteria bacterium]|jgi:hypothetical protein|nr:hypothetical protein [Pseudomonadota bacterium]
MTNNDCLEIKDTINAFTAQFGKLDTHTMLALEVLFNLIYLSNKKENNGKNIPLSGQARQKRN